jgi:uncharacterized protein
MRPETYLSRIVDSQLQQLLRAVGAVVIEGPKACGKTVTARQLAASEVLLDVDENARAAAELDPRLILAGDTPRLIDEWQTVERLWNQVRREVDDRGVPGQFILTGSAVPADDATRHSGALRIARLPMRPMSLFELGRSSGRVSLSALLDGVPVKPEAADMTVTEIATEIAVGGWPALRARRAEPAEAMLSVRGYIDEIRRTDIRRVDGVRRDPERVLRLMQSLARNVSTYVADTTLAADTAGTGGQPLDRDTVADYLNALKRLFVVEDQPAWTPHLRSRYQLRSSPKRHFVDPSLAVAALRITGERALRDIKLFGFLFESLVVRDLRVYAQAVDAEVRQYRDSRDLEVDAVVQAADGRWAAFEVKLGSGRVDEAADTLETFAKQIDPGSTGEPATLGVIVSEGYAHMRDDGVAVIPIATLGP